MKKFISVTLLGLMLPALVLTVLHRADAQSAAEEWQVELDVYSGLPNPVFTLTSEELTQAKERLSKAMPLRADVPASDGVRPSVLGYRGLIVRNLSSAAAKSAAAGPASPGPDLELFSAKILQREASSQSILDDRASGLERYLVTLVQKRALVPAPIAAAIQKSLP